MSAILDDMKKDMALNAFHHFSETGDFQKAREALDNYVAFNKPRQEKSGHTERQTVSV